MSLPVILHQRRCRGGATRTQPGDVVSMHPNGIGDRELEATLRGRRVDGDANRERSEETSSEVRVFRAPPRAAANDDDREDDHRAGHREPGTSAALCVWLHAGRQHTLAHRRADDREQA
jgi:hypothetical protein